MFNSGILDLVVGLTFVYSLLSLVSTAINEIVEAVVKMRSVDLERGIREMLTGQKDPYDTSWLRKLFSFFPRREVASPATQPKADLVQQLYNHPLIYSLFQGDYEMAKKARKLPSYIPSRNFALALMDLVLPATLTTADTSAQSSGATGATVQTPNPLQSLRDAISGLTDEKTRQVLKTLIETIEAKVSDTTGAPASANIPIKSLRDAISKFSANEKVKQALMTLVDAAGNDIVQARKNIQDWFDSSMDRVSGGYKRRVQWITLILGLGMVILVNADTLAIGSSLYTSAAMRDSLVAAAQEYAKANPSPLNPENAEPPTQACTSPECRVTKNLDEIQKLGLPIGWTRDDPRSFPDTSGAWLTKVFGWLLTAFAISLGSPFWFDLLNKVMIVRSTVRPKEKSPEEPAVNR
jgi:hypothetical protein